MINLKIRRETKADYCAVENLTREAFWDLYQPGCVEHLLVHKLRNVPAFLPELDFIAQADDQVVGSILYSRSAIIDKNLFAHEVITFGPVGVLPLFQKKGIGSALITHTIPLAKRMGYRAIVLFGNPAYYRRFGFLSAQHFGIMTAEGESCDALMALELFEGALQEICGRFLEDPVFHVDPTELEAFDQLFPKKEKHVTDAQLR